MVLKTIPAALKMTGLFKMGSCLDQYQALTTILSSFLVKLLPKLFLANYPKCDLSLINFATDSDSLLVTYSPRPLFFYSTPKSFLHPFFYKFKTSHLDLLNNLEHWNSTVVQPVHTVYSFD